MTLVQGTKLRSHKSYIRSALLSISVALWCVLLFDIFMLLLPFLNELFLWHYTDMITYIVFFLLIILQLFVFKCSG